MRAWHSFSRPQLAELAVVIFLAIVLANLVVFGFNRLYAIEFSYPVEVLISAVIGAVLGLVLRWRWRQRQPAAE